MERPFKIAFWYYGESKYNEGGAAAYTTALQHLLLQHQFDSIELVCIGYNIENLNSNVPKLSLKPIYDQPFLRLLQSILLRLPIWGKKWQQLVGNKYTKKLIEQIKQEDIEVIYYVKPGIMIDNFPHISTLWDLGHISSFAFPEMSMHGKLESRVTNFDRDINKALIICVESEAGKEELVDYYPVNPNRIEVIPMIPSEVVTPVIKIEKVEVLEGVSYFLYPAKYWPHKNHHTLIQAFKIFLKDYPATKLVFSGDNSNNYTYINQVITDLGLQEQVIQLGLVSLENLKWLYQNAISLVMPTLLGPTNMPLLEAYYLGCNVACSDFKGHREQLKNHAVYFDPLNASAIAESMKMTYLKYQSGKNEVVDFNHEATIEALKKVFNKAKMIKRNWGKMDKIS